MSKSKSVDRSGASGLFAGRPMFAVWFKDREDWLRERNVSVPDPPVLVFRSRRQANRRAAEEYGFASYSEAKKKDWVEVREI